MSPTMEADYARWCHDQQERKAKLDAAGKAIGTFEGLRDRLKAAFETLPEKVDVPFHLTPEGERMAKFKTVLLDSPEFMARIDRAKLPNPDAFDRVAKWDGQFPGPCAIGPTRTAKTRAAWSAIGRLYVRENKPFAWYPVRRLVTELARYEEAECAADFFRMADFHSILFVDDVDKLNWDFNSEKTALFSFFDWVYRHHKPVITTTNKDRKWWCDKMGDAFARRLIDDAHFAVGFGLPLDQAYFTYESLIARDFHIAPVEPGASLFPHLVPKAQVAVIRAV